jgi:hypothetical protein
MCVNLEDLGIPLTHQKIVPGATATAIGSEFYQYTERTVAYTSGGTTEIVAGDWIIGATSAAKAQVVSLTLTGGTWAGGDAAGVMRLRSQHGTFQSENLNVEAGSNLATIATNSRVADGDYPFKGMLARAAFVQATAQTALINMDGGKPGQTSIVGLPLVANANITIKDVDAIRKFKCIDYTNAQATTVQVTLFF